jgi:ADP-heptose:LPS heptosyltransferase
MVLVTPMLQGLRIAQPTAHITVIAGSNEAADVIRGSKLCDEVRVMSFRRSPLTAILSFFVKMRAERFDAAFIASRLSPCVALFLRFLSDIKVVVGDGTGNRGWGYTHWRRVDATRHRVIENAEIIRLRLPHAGIGDLYFHIDEEARMEAARIWSDHKLDGCIVLGIHPGGAASECPDKEIPVELSREAVQQFLADSENRKVVLFFGPDESNRRSLYEWGFDRVVLLSGLRLSAVGAAIARCRAFLSGDTGLGHIAAAVGTPVVTVAGPTDIDHTRPWGDGHLVVRTAKHLPCMPCYETALYGRCPYNQECMWSISSRVVLAAIEHAASLTCTWRG